MCDIFKRVCLTRYLLRKLQDSLKLKLGVKVTTLASSQDSSPLIILDHNSLIGANKSARASYSALGRFGDTKRYEQLSAIEDDSYSGQPSGRFDLSPF